MTETFFMNKILIAAEPSSVEIAFDETALIIIDMQKDFLYHDGFGELLGNDVTLLQRTIKPTRAVLQAWRNYRLSLRPACDWLTMAGL